MPPLKGTEASLSYEQCFLYLVSSSVNVSICHSVWLATLWTDLEYPRIAHMHTSQVHKQECSLRNKFVIDRTWKQSKYSSVVL